MPRVVFLRPDHLVAEEAGVPAEEIGSSRGGGVYGGEEGMVTGLQEHMSPATA